MRFHLQVWVGTKLMMAIINGAFGWKINDGIEWELNGNEQTVYFYVNGGSISDIFVMYKRINIDWLYQGERKER